MKASGRLFIFPLLCLIAMPFSMAHSMEEMGEEPIYEDVVPEEPMMADEIVEAPVEESEPIQADDAGGESFEVASNNAGETHVHYTYWYSNPLLKEPQITARARDDANNACTQDGGVPSGVVSSSHTSILFRSDVTILCVFQTAVQADFMTEEADGVMDEAMLIEAE